MAERLDLIIFGITGFTGKYTIPAVHDLCNQEGRKMTWGAAGRSESKIKAVLEEMSKKVGADFSNIPITIADVKDEESLKLMTAKARVIINTCGPYRFYGEPLIKACIETGTHHVDVSGEPQYMETMQLKYNKQAEEKGVYIVSACGFDSIPSDLGLFFMQSKFEGTLNSVETYLETEVEGGPYPGPAINYGTWESAVYGLAHEKELKKIRSELYPERLPKFEPVLMPRQNVHKSEITNKYTMPFLGSDRAVMNRSQRFFYENEKIRPVQVRTYFCVDSLMAVIFMVILGGIFAVLTKFSFGRKLLLDYPHIFSMGLFHKTEQPSEEKTKNTKFSVTLNGEGWSEKLASPNDKYTTPPNKRIVAKVSGTNPGYGATTMSLALTAVTILKEASKMPKNGGVFPPAAAFGHTSLIEQLNKNGLKFEVVSTKDI